MDIEKATAEIVDSLKEDTTESVKTTLENVKREFGAMQVSLKAANEEAKTNRLKAGELRGKLEDADLQISKLSDDTKLKEMQADYEKQIGEYKTQNEKLTEAQKQLYGIFRKEFITSFDRIKEHPNFEKVKDILKIPEKKEDKYDFDSLSDEAVLFNKAKLAEYDSLGLFVVEGKSTSPQIPITEKIKDIDIVELAKTNPEEARKYLDKKRRRSLFG